MRIPTDAEAEENVVGVTLLRPGNVARVRGVVLAEDFYNVELGRLYGAVELLEDIGPFIPAGLDGVDAFDFPRSWVVRAVAVATLADVPFLLVERLCEQAPVMTDATPWAARVVKAAVKRRAMANLADAYNALGGGAELHEVLPLLKTVAA